MKEKLRFLINFILIVIFAGFLIISVLKFRYNVSGVEKDEFFITRRSVSHGIERRVSGELIDKSIIKGTDGVLEKREPEIDKIKPCPS